MERKEKKEELIERIFNVESNMSLFACAHFYLSHFPYPPSEEKRTPVDDNCCFIYYYF